MGARILILQERAGAVKELHESLGTGHELILASTAREAKVLMIGQKIDLIVVRVHLERTNIFAFLRDIQTDERVKHIPIVCFCGRQTNVSKSLDPILAQSCRALGAKKYLSLETYRRGFTYDFENLRKDIESCL